MDEPGADAIDRPSPTLGRPVDLLASYAPQLLERVDEARSLDEIAPVADGHGGLVRVLATVGVAPLAIAAAVALLNDRVMDRLYRICLPEEAVRNTCLIAMGSEGRREQILRTDQDNGVVVRDGFAWDGLPDALGRFSAGLIQLGWPPCKGNVMVTNPFWVRTEAGWTETVGRWIRLPDGESSMDLAILIDAAAVSGDPALLARVKRALHGYVDGHGSFLAQFAQAALQFDTPLRWFGHLVTEQGDHRGRLDLKKGGIFPIVHGARALALEAHIAETSTLDRLTRLAERNVIDPTLAVDLREAFEFLVGLRVKARLDDLAEGGGANLVAPAALAPDEREELRLSLRTVKLFKDVLSYHFHLLF